MASSTDFYRPAFPPKAKPYISTGKPFPETCDYHVTNTFKASRVYVIVSNSISKTENFTSLEQALGDKIVGVRKGIRPHTPWDDVIDIVKEIKEKDADLIITLGAGSLTDGAKVISFLKAERALANDVSTVDGLSTLTTDAKTPGLKPCAIPTINVPTSLSGGEYSPFAGATDKRTDHKAGFAHPSMGADLIILDPKLSTSTPEETWLASGIRSVDHCVEGLSSLHENASDESDKNFVRGLKLLVPSLLATKKNWNAEEPRLQEMLGVIEAMKGLSSGVPMGGSHGIGHQLGPLGVGHGQTSCVMLPSVLKYNYKHGDAKVKNRQQKILDVLWEEKTVADLLTASGLDQKTADAGDVVGSIIAELNLPRSLKDVGVGREKLDALAENCLKDRWLKTNAIPLTTKEQVLEILYMAAGDGKSNI